MKTARFCAFALIFAVLLSPVAFADEESGGASSEPAAASAEGESSGGAASSSPARGFALSYGYRPLVAPDGTRASNYVKGSPPPVSYVERGGSCKVAENSYTFRDYVFTGWSCGGTLYRPGEMIYNVQSDMHFVAQWARPTRPAMEVLGVLNYREGGKITQTVSAEVGAATTLGSGRWRDGEGRVFAGGSAFLLSATRADFEASDAPADAVTVRYDGVESGAQCPFSIERGGVFTVDGCFAVREGFAFTGWECGGRLYLDGDSCEAASDTVFTPVWRELDKPKPDFCKVGADAGEGGKISPPGQSSVERGHSFTFTAVPDRGFALVSVVCGGKELGTNGSYTVTVNSDLQISASFVKTEVPSEPEPEKSREPEPPKPSVGTSAEPPSDEGGSGRRSGTTIAAAALCALGLALALWYSVKSGGRGKKQKRGR